jgi:hypothetical protein
LYPFESGYDEPRPELNAALLFPVRAKARTADRPRNEQEAAVSAFSNDWGITWHFTAETLQLNPYCPSDQTDPDNLNVNVNGLPIKYGSDPNSAADNGLGHPLC